jgi:hypothetical protein
MRRMKLIIGLRNGCHSFRRGQENEVFTPQIQQNLLMLQIVAQMANLVSLNSKFMSSKSFHQKINLDPLHRFKIMVALAT